MGKSVNLKRKISYINRIFESDVVSEFNMSEADLDTMLEEDHVGEDIVAAYKPILEMAREMRAMNRDLKELSDSISEATKVYNGEGGNFR